MQELQAGQNRPIGAGRVVVGVSGEPEDEFALRLQAGMTLLGGDGRMIDLDDLVSAERPCSRDGSVRFACPPGEFQIDLDAVAQAVARIALVLTVRPALPRGTTFGVFNAIRAWLAVRQPVAPVPWVWLNLGRRVKRVQLDEDGLGEVLRRLKKAAGITGRVNPHSFRHAFAREWLRNGGDLATLSAMLGHADPAVTARFYAVFTDFELGEFHERFSPLTKLVETD